MTKKLKLVAFLLGMAPLAFAQTEKETTSDAEEALKQDNAAFVFTESQLGEDDDVTQNVIMVNSNNNVYTSNVGYQWSQTRFKFRAYNSRYNDIYFNGVQVNNAENGQFNYSTIGGMNRAVNGHIDASGAFESNAFAMSSIGGSSNYNFRANSYAAGHNITLSACNRNYTARAMYSYGTGVTKKGWAFFGTVGYRWANMNTAAVEGTFYNSLSYFLAVQKIFNERHSLNLSTWGNPTERAQQGASTDEAYWLANDRQYNPYWGYQDGKKRSSRVVNNYEPTAMLTWDFKINDRMKLTTSLLGKYAMYSSSKLNYSGTNPHPDYWKNFPSYNYDVWGDGGGDVDAWQESYNFWTASKHNRQINFDELYFANQQLNASGHDAIYYIERRHNDHLNLGLGSTFDWNVAKDSKLQFGLQLNSNKGMHYETMDDLLGGQYFHNRNTYAEGTYANGADQIYYDLNNKDGLVRKGDRFRYDYNLLVESAKLWATWTKDKGISHNFVSARVGGTEMWRDGKMNNGIFANYTDANGKLINLSYGKSKKARFLDGGFKMGTNLNLGHGNAITMGVGYEARAPYANVAFVSPEMNNNFVKDLVNEKIFTSELGYALNNKWVQLNLTAYFTHTYDGTEWQQFYNDNENSFTYNSLTGVEKNYYGAELGVKVKVTSNFNINLLGTIAEAKYASHTNVTYMLSNSGTEYTDLCLNKGMRESGTPLAAASLGLNYNIKGWWFNLSGNYYDRIYLSYSPNMRYRGLMTANNDGSYSPMKQAKSDGGFMLDGSIGKGFRMSHGRYLSINLMVNNITNNRKLCTGGYEQSRSTTYTTRENQEVSRTYNFQKNPKKFYAQGINGMLNLSFRF
ncbi:MAG: TonB-dependent receptor [Bacteroidaceae bacterium]|nr:TonB-dependent receptor [Bacteroidaceae bacterium]MBR1789594.1 TonB-dependent receptor [Bacteroidaceae bacterium]